MVTIGIATYNGKHLWERGLLIKSLQDQTDLDFETIIVDDNSEDGTVEYMQTIQLPNLRIFRTNAKEHPLSRASGLSDNIMIREAKGESFVHLDHDCYVDKHLVAFAKEALRTANRPVVIWGETVSVHSESIMEVIQRDVRMEILEHYKTDAIKLKPEWRAAHGALFIAPTDILRQTGGHDMEHCEQRGQDSRYGARLNQYCDNYFTSKIKCYHLGKSHMKMLIDEHDRSILPKEERLKILVEKTKAMVYIPEKPEAPIQNGGLKFFLGDYLNQYYEQIL